MSNKLLFLLFAFNFACHFTSPAACGEVPTHWEEKKNKKTMTMMKTKRRTKKQNHRFRRSKGKVKGSHSKGKGKGKAHISSKTKGKTNKKKTYYPKSYKRSDERKSEDYYIKKDHYNTYEWMEYHDEWRKHKSDDYSDDEKSKPGNKKKMYESSSVYEHSHRSKGKGWKPPKSKPPSMHNTRLVLNLLGSSVGERMSFPGTSEGLQLLCFNDLHLFDLHRNVSIGKANNCISFQTTSSTNSSSFFQLDIISETTVFDIKDGDYCDVNLTFVLVPNIVPKRKGLPGFIVSTTESQPMNNIVFGDGCGFTDDTIGSIRSSGFILVNATMTTFTFDYIYVIDFSSK